MVDMALPFRICQCAHTQSSTCFLRRCGALHPGVRFAFLLWFSPRSCLGDQVDRRVKKHMSRVWLQLNEVEPSSRFEFDYLLTDVTLRSPYSQPHGSGRSVSLWWRAPTTSMVWCIGFKMSWYVCTALQHGSRRRACGSVHCVDVLVAQVAGWFRAECVNSIVGCRTESVVGWSSQPRTQEAQRSAQVNLLVCVCVTLGSCQSWHRLRVLLFTATFA